MNSRRYLSIAAIVVLAAAATYRLAYAFARLLFNYQDWANVDLRFFHRLVHGWFAGEPIPGSVYPPATYALLWPFLGWLDIPSSRWLWAVTSVAALVWLIVWLLRESGATRPSEKIALALLPVAMYSTAATIGNGQLAVHVMPALLVGTVWAYRRPRWPASGLVAALFVFALIKPTISAPFFWIVIFCGGSLTPAILVVVGYVALTLLAALLREPQVVPVVRESLSSGVEGVAIGSAEIGGGFANLHDWFAAVGLERFNLIGSLVVLALLGLWTFRNRRAEVWLLLGVAALVARFWSYHRLHDDLLILIPMITLFRRSSGNSLAAWLLAVNVTASLVPAGLLFAPPPLNWLFDVGQTVVWSVTLIYLLILTARSD